ncbi:MAG: FAD-dependent oxidoreductase [Acidimicrobiales bacterium]
MSEKVAIIGGGFTGLTAAYRLAEAGVDVTIFEAGNELGGLASGFELLGQPAEKAYHFLYRTDEHMLRTGEGARSRRSAHLPRARCRRTTTTRSTR